MKKRREEMRLTQAELAEKLGVKENSVWRWENDRQEISKTIDLAMQTIERKYLDSKQCNKDKE